MAVSLLPKHQAILNEVLPSARGHISHAVSILEVAQRPLTADELLHAMFVDFTTWYFVPSSTQTEIRQLLSSTAVLETSILPCPGGELESAHWDEERNTFCINAIRIPQRFRQGSRQSNGQKTAAWMARTHGLMAWICLVYLMNCDSPPSSHGILGNQSQALAAYGDEYRVLQWQEAHPFATYAAKYWPIHSYLARSGRNAPEDENLLRAELALFESREYMEKWLQVYDAADTELRSSAAPKKYSWVSSRSSLYHAAFHGLEPVTQALLDQSLESPDCDTARLLSEALQATSFRSNIAMTEYLLSRGAIPNANAGPFHNALVAGAAGGSTDILGLLLSCGGVMPVEVDQQHPLLVSATNGHGQTVSFLADRLGASRQDVLDGALAEMVNQFGSGGGSDDMIGLLMQLGARSLHESPSE